MKPVNIRPSLRLYFIVATIFLVSLITVAFSALSLENLHRGVNIGSTPLMSRLASVDGVSDGNPVEVFDFVVASRWQDLPQGLRDLFDDQPTDQLRTIQKSIIGGSFLVQPDGVGVYIRVHNAKGEERFVGGIHLLPEDMKKESFQAPPFFGLFF